MTLLKLPGLIDPHVHLREPGQTDKEDFYTGTASALAGGYTTVLDMPNNTIPITTKTLLENKEKIAKEKIVCDVGFHFGTVGDNFDEFANIPKNAFGLKIYLNETTGNFLVQEENLEHIFDAWQSRPILLHAEGSTLDRALVVGAKTRKRIHICHISNRHELEAVIRAKEQGVLVTCGVTTHHLFLTQDDERALGPFGKMKPPLQKREDVDFLWKNIAAIDCIESDHAPHTKQEKEHPENGKVPFGVPGLETQLPLLLTAVTEGKLTIDDVLRLCHDGPKTIFHVPQDPDTYTEIDLQASYDIRNTAMHTKCGWTPFAGKRVQGRVVRVFLRGKKVYEDGIVLATPGSGHLITPQ